VKLTDKTAVVRLSQWLEKRPTAELFAKKTQGGFYVRIGGCPALAATFAEAVTAATDAYDEVHALTEVHP
jgi:hypothetical protein